MEKQRLAYRTHALVLDEAKASGDDLLHKVEILLKAVRSWSGTGAVDSTFGDNIIGSKLDLDDLDMWLLQAKKDPNFSPDILKGWADTLETHINHSSNKLEYAKLFGNLLNEWIFSGDSAIAVNDAQDSQDMDSDEQFVGAGRKEMYEQKEHLNSIIFDPVTIDADALHQYMSELFSEEKAKMALTQMRDHLEVFGKNLRRRTVSLKDVETAVAALLRSGLLSEEKRATLQEFSGNRVILHEVSNILTMRLADLESWSWPSDGVAIIEMRRHLNGRYRAFTDPEIVDALFLQHFGSVWRRAFENSFDDFRYTWKSTSKQLSVAQKTERKLFNLGTESIDDIRAKFRAEFHVSAFHQTTNLHIDYFHTEAR